MTVHINPSAMGREPKHDMLRRVIKRPVPKKFEARGGNFDRHIPATSMKTTGWADDFKINELLK